MRSFDIFFDLCLNERSSKQSWGWWFGVPSRPLWRHSNEQPLADNSSWLLFFLRKHVYLSRSHAKTRDHSLQKKLRNYANCYPIITLVYFIIGFIFITSLWQNCTRLVQPSCHVFIVWILTFILSVGFLIHHLSTSPLPCKGVSDAIVGTSSLGPLEDTNFDTCVAPLNHGSKIAKITLEIFGRTNTTLEVVTAISKEASCNTPGVVLAAETAEKNHVECTLMEEDDSNVNFRVCRYKCLCNRCCAFVHIYFYNLHAKSLENTAWQLCDLQICFP